MVDRVAPAMVNQCSREAPPPGAHGKGAEAGISPGDSVELASPGFSLSRGEEKKVLISQLLGDGIGPEERLIIENALSGYSRDNLALLARSGLRIHVREIGDMPLHYGVREYFAGTHEKALNGFLQYLVSRGAADEAQCAALASADEKKDYIRQAIVTHGLEVGFDSPDFGKWSWVDRHTTGDLERATSAPAVCAAHGGEGGRPDYLEIFVVRHNLSAPILIHEVGHALDTLKSPDESSEKDPVKRDFMRSVNPEIPGGSLRNSGLQLHYRQFARNCSGHPEKIWSTYALSSGKIREYMAEAIRVCVMDPGKLREADRELYEFTKALLESPSYPSYTFTNR